MRKDENRNEIGPGTVKPTSFEMGGRPGLQTISVVRGLRTKLAEARGGELNAAAALRKLRPTLERTLIRAEADALHATSAVKPSPVYFVSCVTVSSLDLRTLPQGP